MRLWDWADNARVSIDGPTGYIIGRGKIVNQGEKVMSKRLNRKFPGIKLVKHLRNIRAVLFHPFGNILFLAAPDVAKKEEATSLASRLFK